MAAVLAGLLVLAPAAPARVSVRPVALTVDGERATGLRFERVGRRPRKLVVFAHGHGEAAEDFRPELTRLAEDTGAAVVAMDYRGPRGAWNVGAGARDTVAATRWYLRRNRRIRHTVLWGWSMGGMVSGMAAADAPELYDHWVASFPAVNAIGAWALFTALGLDDRTELERDAGCSFAACPDRYVERSPSLLAGRMEVRRAILLHGMGDLTSPYEQSREMQLALVAAGVPVSLYTFLTPPGAGHGRGPVADESQRVVERLLAGAEPLDGPSSEYVLPGS